jgi:ferredoxin
MPKVKFVVEHQVVEVEAGRKLREIAQEAGINVDREFFRGLNCHGLGLCGCCKVWVHPLGSGALNSPNLRERFHGMSARRRLACQVRVQGDVEVTSVPGGDDRLERKREISPTPDPVHDASAVRKPVDEGGSIAHPLGHPSAVGNGETPALPLKEPAKQEAKPAAAKGEPDKQDLSATKREAPKAKDKPAASVADASPPEAVGSTKEVEKEPAVAQDDKKAESDASAK